MVLKLHMIPLDLSIALTLGLERKISFRIADPESQSLIID